MCTTLTSVLFQNDCLLFQLHDSVATLINMEITDSSSDSGQCASFNLSEIEEQGVYY